LTLVLAIGCTDGVVMAADSASSDTETGTKQPTDKIRRVGDHLILYGGSGDVGLLQKIDNNLATLHQWSDLKGMCREIKNLIVPEQREAVQSHVNYPQMPFNLPPTAILLFAGVHNDQPWILEIERNGGDTIYGEKLGNFAAIGSGKPWAQALFRPHLYRERDLELGKIFAYRILDDAINLAAGGLAKPIRIYTISLDHIVREVEGGELVKIAETCETWRELEREAVGALVAGEMPEESAPPIPEP
jgi:20S proteasome alpha/beta subunit